MIVKGATHLPVLDFEGALARLGGDKQLFAEMVGILLEDMPPLVAKLRDAVAAGNAAAIRAHAHALAGLLAGCGGERAARMARALEAAGESQQLNGSSAMMDSLDAGVAVLSKVLRNYRT